MLDPKREMELSDLAREICHYCADHFGGLAGAFRSMDYNGNRQLCKSEFEGGIASWLSLSDKTLLPELFEFINDDKSQQSRGVVTKEEFCALSWLAEGAERWRAEQARLAQEAKWRELQKARANARSQQEEPAPPPPVVPQVAPPSEVTLLLTLDPLKAPCWTDVRLDAGRWNNVELGPGLEVRIA